MNEIGWFLQACPSSYSFLRPLPLQVLKLLSAPSVCLFFSCPLLGFCTFSQVSAATQIFVSSEGFLYKCQTECRIKFAFFFVFNLLRIIKKLPVFFFLQADFVREYLFHPHVLIRHTVHQKQQLDSVFETSVS